MGNAGPRSRWQVARQLFVGGDDPYAGADLTSSRNATAVLVALHGLLVLILLPLFPPTEGAGEAIGWTLALGGVAVNLASAAWLFGMPEVRFGVMLAVAYSGIAELVMLQLLAQTVLPYQALFLIWVGASAVQPARRALVLLAAIVAATLAPLVVGADVQTGDVVGLALLLAAISLVLIAYVGYVRAQRLTLQGQERDARAHAMAATKRVRDLQWITDAALPHAGLQELLEQLLSRIATVFDADHGAILLRAEGESRFELRATHGIQQDADARVPPLSSQTGSRGGSPSRAVRSRSPETMRVGW